MNEPRYGTPTDPGLFWYKLQGSSIWRYQMVIEQGGRLCVINEAIPIPVEQMKRKWFGPLPKPEAP